MVDRLMDQVEKEERDQRVLRVIIEEGPIGSEGLAAEMDMPEHKVRYSLHMLENDGLVEPTPEGNVAADDVDEQLAAIARGIDDLVARLESIKGIF